MANKVYSSPNVYISEKDLTFSVETVGVTTLGLVGETQKGPAFQPFFIKNYDEFQTYFGGTSPEKFKNTQIPKYELPYISKAYLTQSNQLYVTRVLGLSGYNAGMAWTLRTIGMCDSDTLAYTATTSTLKFAEDGDAAYLVTGTTITSTLLNDAIEDEVGVTNTKYDGVFNTFYNIGSASAGYATSGVTYWGVINSAVTTTNPFSGNTWYDAYELPSTVPTADQTNHWLINEFDYDSTNDNYTGTAFLTYVSATDMETLVSGSTSATTSTFTVTVTKLAYTCDPKADYHKKAVATIRSSASYVADELIPSIVAETGVTITGSTLDNDIYADFTINVTTSGGTNYSYDVSMDPDQKNYIKKVIGSTPTERDSQIWVEQTFDASLSKGYLTGWIKGLEPTLAFTNTWAHYETQYQTPVTPFFVSELRGGIPLRLFRFIAISDGEDANTEVKASIANIDLSRKTFDVYIRNYDDTDRRPSIIEKYLNCTMDENDDSYIGRKIGTVDNKYDLKSSYIMVEVDEDAPADAVPAGFEGYSFRNLGDDVITPDMTYKTRYYSAGDTKYDPMLASAVISSGDKVKKAYLGFSDVDFGWDSDLLKYQGINNEGASSNQWNTGESWTHKSKGFHMDSAASTLVTSVGDTAFEVGEGSFQSASVIAADSSHPYYDVRTRKFTALFYGGFDGWDIHRDYRTNEDTYQIGRDGFVDGGFSSSLVMDEFDNEVFGTSDYYAYLYGIKTFKNPEDVSINIFATPGIDIINNTELVRECIDMMEEDRLDSIYLPTLPDVGLIGNTDPSDTDNWLYPDDIVTELEGAELDTNYAATFYPWVQIYDTENASNIYLPPTAEVVRNLALTDNVAHPWYASAGYSRGLVNCKRARIKLDQEQRDTLYEGKINPLATYTDINVVIWGNKNLQDADTALNRLNIRRLMLQAQKLIISVSKRLLFDPNDDRVRSEFLSLVNPILDNIRKERGLYDFRVTVSNDPEDLDRNTLSGRIFLKPTRTLEFIELEFNLTPTSVSFDAVS